jgi:hypothetical protein
MGGPDRGGGDAFPADIEPERGHVPENDSPQGSSRLAWGSSHPPDVADVLNEHVARFKLANESLHLAPQKGFGVLEPVALPGAGDATAGEPAGDEVDRCSDVSANSNSFPVGPGLRAWPSFAKPCGVGSSLTSQGADVIEHRHPGEPGPE